MNVNNHQKSAKIYQFPARSRGVFADRRAPSPAENTRLYDAAPGDCWYHDAAVQQSAGPINARGK
jgi:hypothetical protein